MSQDKPDPHRRHDVPGRQTPAANKILPAAGGALPDHCAPVPAAARLTLETVGISITLAVSSYQGCKLINQVQAPAEDSGRCQLINGAAVWTCSLQLDATGAGIFDAVANFRLAAGSEPCGAVAVLLAFDGWSRDNYVLLPAAAYRGNRFRVVPASYPPFLHDRDGIGPDMPVTITDVPRLNAGAGLSEIHLRSGDMATPCLGVYMPEQQMGCLILFEPIAAFGYTGVRLVESEDRRTAEVRLEAPAVRRNRYTMASAASPGDDAGASFAAGDLVALRFRIVLADCPGIPALFDLFFDQRKQVCGSWQLVHQLPFSAAYRIIEQKYNEKQFNEEYGYYRLSPAGSGGIFGDWQAGWCGGGLSSLALFYDGSALSAARANRTLDAVFGVLQNRNGFILPIFAGGQPYGDDFCHQDRQNVLLVRKDADVLVFAARHILLCRRRRAPVPQIWLDGLAALADAFVRLWQRNGQFGQFIDIETEQILIGGTAAGSMVPGGLALAWQVLERAQYRTVAEASAAYYYRQHVEIGLLNGGPGEILQNADSESASNMLESFVILYETTGDRRWLPMAEDTARQCASWCVSYDFVFPSASVFGRLGMRSLGSVYANVQNKHAAPGFCTLSGASLLRLYRATGDRRYLELGRETAHNITQYLSRADRPIPTWDGKELPPGWMCERVNLSDWEGKENIGGVFYGSCWCEVSCLLTYAEIPGIWFLTDTGEAIVLDHVDVTVTDAGTAWLLHIKNPTRFDAAVKLLCEPRSDFAESWDPCITDSCPILMIKAGGCRTEEIAKDRRHLAKDHGCLYNEGN